MEFFDWMFYGNSLKQWIFTAIFVIIVFSAIEIAKKIILGHLVTIGARFRKEIYDLGIDLFRNTNLFLALSLYIGSHNLAMSAGSVTLVNDTMIIVLLVQVFLWGNRSISFWLASYTRRKLKEDAATVTMITAFSYIGRIVLWVILVLIALDNLGFNIRTLITGVGIGGIAIALAVQNILKDLFASLSIATDKPFVYGDFIAVGDFQGEIEYVGLKTTRIRSLTGEQIIISNSDLLQSRIKNYQRMRNRRGAFTIGVTYQTPHDKLQKIPGIIRGIIQRHEKTRVERVHFTSFGPSALHFEAVYWVDDPDYNLFMDTQQEINLDIFRRFDEEGITFAYPTQTVIVETIPPTAKQELRQAGHP